METCVFAGTFDPVTKGHEEIVLKAVEKYGKVVVVVGVNAEKTPFFSLDDRISFLRETFSENDCVSVDFYDGYMADYMRKNGYTVYIRGIRGEEDLPYENLMKANNERLNPDMRTVFIFSDGKYSSVSSTAVRERIEKGEPFAELLPERILSSVERAVKKRKANK